MFAKKESKQQIWDILSWMKKMSKMELLSSLRFTSSGQKVFIQINSMYLFYLHKG